MNNWRIDIETVVCGSVVLVLLFLLAFGICQDVKHQAFLKAHGCRLLTEAQTGRWIQAGKTGHPEHVYVYECADGTRTEVH